MEQNQIIGREIAVAKAYYDTEKKEYLLHSALTVDPVTLDLYGVSEESLDDCMKQLKAMGTFDEITKALSVKDDDYKNTGLVIGSKKDPRVTMSVEFGRRWNKDDDAQADNTGEKDLTLKFFLDVDSLLNKGEGEHAVSPEELDIMNKLRVQPKTEGVEMDKQFFDDFDAVDQFGMPKLATEEVAMISMKPLTPAEEKSPEEKDKELEKKAADLKDNTEKPKEVGSEAIAKPAETVQVGVKSGESEHKESEIKVGDVTKKDGVGEVMQGSGSSDDQQKELAAKEIKLGKPGDDHGKVMESRKVKSIKDVKKLRERMDNLFKKRMAESKEHPVMKK